MIGPTLNKHGATPTDDVIARHRDELKQRFPLPPPVKKTKRVSAAKTSAVASALALVVSLVWIDPAYRTEFYSSDVGRLAPIKLADGSMVILDSASRIRISWHLRSRRAELQAGQALFDISPAQYRPFRTLAGSTEITVHGTRYNVARQRDTVQVTVEEGRVGVRVDGTELPLTAGDRVVVRQGKLGMRTRVDANNVTAWASGRLVFDQTPLGDVIEVLERYRNIHVTLDDDSLAELAVTGSFNSARLDTVLPLLPKVLPVDLFTDTEGVLHITRRASKK